MMQLRRSCMCCTKVTSRAAARQRCNAGRARLSLSPSTKTVMEHVPERFQNMACFQYPKSRIIALLSPTPISTTPL